MTRFDRMYRNILVTSKFFPKGWGRPDDLKKIFEFRKKLSNRNTCRHMVDKIQDHVYIDKEKVEGDMQIIQGHFVSPVQRHLPGVMPDESTVARFKVILPKVWETEYKPVCIHLAGTGDHGFRRREKLMAQPLLKKGIASILLENPYYGSRKPKQQRRSSLLHVSDLFVMGAGLTLESLVLLDWCESQGFGPLGITGISMGGHMACLAASNWDKPLVLVPCLSWTTASSVFTRGVLKEGVQWKKLTSQYMQDETYREMNTVLNSQEKFDLSLYSRAKDHHLCFQQPLPVDENEVVLNTRPTTIIPPQDGEPSSQKQNTDQSSMWRKTVNNLPSVSDIDFKSIRNYMPSMPEIDLRAVYEKTPDMGMQHIHASRQYIREKWQMMRDIDKDSLEFMINVMDECTHLGHYSIPVDPSLIIIVTARHDGYIPRDRVQALDEIWEGAEVRYIDAGHVGAFLTKRTAFITAIEDSFNRSIDKYHSPKPVSRLSSQDQL